MAKHGTSPAALIISKNIKVISFISKENIHEKEISRVIPRFGY